MKITKRTRPVHKANPAASPSPIAPPSPAVAQPAAPPAAAPPAKQHDLWPELIAFARSVRACPGHVASNSAVDRATDCNACCDLLVMAVGSMAATLVRDGAIELIAPNGAAVSMDETGQPVVRLPRLNRKFSLFALPLVLGGVAIAAMLFGRGGRTGAPR